MMTLCEKCFVVSITALLVFFVVAGMLQQFVIRQNRTVYNGNIAVMQQRLNNQNQAVNTMVLQLQGLESREVDMVLSRAGIQRTEPLTKKR